MNERVAVQAETIPCAVPINARAGDRLLIVSGVVVGVVPEEPAAPSPPPPSRAQSPRPPPPSQPPQIPQPPPGTPEPPRLPALHGATLPPYQQYAVPIAERIVQMMREAGRPISAKEIGVRWPRGQGEQPPRLSDAFALLRGRKIIERMPPKPGETVARFPEYYLLELWPPAVPVPVQPSLPDGLEPSWIDEEPT